MNVQLNETIIALKRLNSFSKKKTRKLLENIQNKEDLDFFSAINIGIKLGIFQKNQPIGQFIEAYEHAKQVIQICHNEGIEIINSYDPKFPEALRFESHPLLLYYKGDLDCLNSEKRATVVGTRHPNEAGVAFSNRIGELLAKNNYVVISGLAAESDTVTHKAVLRCHKKTVAFLSSSIMRVNPVSNTELVKEIIDKEGLVMTEFPPLSVPNSGMFIERDKLLAGSPKALFVSEFDDRSGTLQTMSFGAKFKKPIYTLKSLINDPEFNGYEALLDKNIRVNALDWNQLEEIIKDNTFEV